jgi:hypothetical protein
MAGCSGKLPLPYTRSALLASVIRTAARGDSPADRRIRIPIVHEPSRRPLGGLRDDHQH